MYFSQPTEGPFSGGVRSILSGHFKLYQHRRPILDRIYDASFEELVEADPDEHRNLADELAAVRGRLRKEMEQASCREGPSQLDRWNAR